MNQESFDVTRKWVETPSGRIGYIERGHGPVALFVHGVLMNGHLWRHQLDVLSATRRCIAVDLLGHGHTTAAAGQSMAADAQAAMLLEFIDALRIDSVDMVGNDSGGGIALIFAARHSERLRSLTLTDCDCHDNWPPEAFKPFLAMAAAGGLRDALTQMTANKDVYRSPQALGPAYESVAQVSDESIEAYLRPLLASPRQLQDFERFLAAFDCTLTLEVEPQLRALQTPTLIVWGTDDIYFDKKWASWLGDIIPGTRRVVEFEGARLFFPEERWLAFNAELSRFWLEVDASAQARLQ